MKEHVSLFTWLGGVEAAANFMHNLVDKFLYYADFSEKNPAILANIIHYKVRSLKIHWFISL